MKLGLTNFSRETESECFLIVASFGGMARERHNMIRRSVWLGYYNFAS